MKWLLLAGKVAAAAAVLWFVRDKLDAAQLLSILGHPWLVLALPTCWVLNQVLTTLRLHAVLKALQRPVSVAAVFRAAMASLFVGNLTPGVIGADVVKFFYLRHADPGVSRSNLAIVLAFDRVLGLFAIVFWCAAFGLYLARFQPQSIPPQFALLPYLPAGLFVAMLAVLLALDAIVRRMPLPALLRQLAEAYRSLRANRSRAAVAAVMGYNLAAVFVLLSGLVLVGAELHAAAAGTTFVALQYFLVPLVLVAAMLPLTPMGIGIAQVGMAGAYAMFGLDASVGVAVSSLSQLALLLVSLAIGGAVFLFGSRPAAAGATARQAFAAFASTKL